jgi:tRNA nucleotidyltransferase (CCA-adding enzyme)
VAKFYKVGGCVRDSLLGVKSKDIDYSVEAESFDAMREAIVARQGTIWLETEEYFTIRAKVPGMGDCDFVLCRKDGEYTDGRRPDKVEMGTLQDDLARRDFTMNAIAEKEDGTLVDPFGGQLDIKEKVIRCVGHPHDRFGDDFLRMLRAIRFSVTKGFEMASSVEAAIHELGHNIGSVSVDRIRDELHKSLKFDTAKTLGLLSHFDLIHILFSNDKLGLWLEPTTRT